MSWYPMDAFAPGDGDDGWVCQFSNDNCCRDDPCRDCGEAYVSDRQLDEAGL